MLSELQIETIIAETCGTYRTGGSYTFEDVWNCIEKALATHNAGAQEPAAIHDGWMLVKRERIEEIRQYARTEFVNSYLGRNLYDEGSLMKNERIGEEALSNIRDVLSWIEEDEKDRIADHPQPMTDAARDVAFEITPEIASEWARRQDIEHVLKDFSTQRCAIEDARTLHLAEIERLDRAKGE